MPSRKRKSKKRRAALQDPEPSISLSDEDPPPAVDLISLDEPEPQVELGDFSAVWRYLESRSRGVPPLNSAANTEPTPASRKQLLQKSIAFDDEIVVNGRSKGDSDNATALEPGTGTSEEIATSDPVKINSRKQRKKYSSAEDDGDETSWYPSSFEDARQSLSSFRRKSFHSIPPTFSSPNLPSRPTTIPPAAPSAADRRRILIQKLISTHPDEVDRILGQPAGPMYLSNLSDLASRELHIFVDNSNILIGFYKAYKSKHKITDLFFRTPKFDFHAFSMILERGRPVSRKFLAGSNPLVQPVALAQHLGYQVSILERVVDTNTERIISTSSPYLSDSATRPPQRERKREQAVDEILHLKILESLLDVPTPGIIVLATGDAAPAEFSPDGGFLKCIQRALKRGWDVELVCWRKSMSRLWREKAFRVESGEKFRIIELDDFVDELVLE